MSFVLALLAAYALGGSIWPQIVRQRQFFLLGAAGVAGAIVLESFGFRLLLMAAGIIEAAAFICFFVAAGGGTLTQYWRGISIKNLQ